jgi:copper chaperone CopZ
MSITTTTIQVQGMRCDGCAQSVKQGLLGVAGVRTATVDRPGGRAVVEHDAAQADAGTLVRAVRAAGYEASALPAHTKSSP